MLLMFLRCVKNKDCFMHIHGTKRQWGLLGIGSMLSTVCVAGDREYVLIPSVVCPEHPAFLMGVA